VGCIARCRHSCSGAQAGARNESLSLEELPSKEGGNPY